MQYEYQTTFHGMSEDFPPHLAAGWQFQGWHILDGVTGHTEDMPGRPGVVTRKVVVETTEPTPFKLAHWRRARA